MNRDASDASRITVSDSQRRLRKNRVITVAQTCLICRTLLKISPSLRAPTNTPLFTTGGTFGTKVLAVVIAILTFASAAKTVGFGSIASVSDTALVRLWMSILPINEPRHRRRISVADARQSPPSRSRMRHRIGERSHCLQFHSLESTTIPRVLGRRRSTPRSRS